MIKKINSKIIEIKNLTKDTKKIVLSVDGFEFKAGQYVLLELKIDGKIQRRAYSIASAPSAKDKNEVELCIKKVSKKGFVSELFKLKAGQRINLIGPAGKFVVDEKPSVKELVFVSTGTGVAPFKSMIEYLLRDLKFKGKIKLIHGYRYKKDILYENFFDDLEGEFSNFEQDIILSRSSGKDYSKGYVQDFLKKMVGNVKGKEFYICGLKDMIFEVVEKLKSLGVKDGKIFFEKYD